MQNQPSGIRENKRQLGVGRAHAIHPCGGLADAYRAMLFYAFLRGLCPRGAYATKTERTLRAAEMREKPI